MQGTERALEWSKEQAESRGRHVTMMGHERHRGEEWAIERDRARLKKKMPGSVASSLYLSVTVIDFAATQQKVRPEGRVYATAPLLCKRREVVVYLDNAALLVRKKRLRG